MIKTTNIPQANPLAENQELMPEIVEAVERVLNNGHYVQGPEVLAFEQEFANFIGVHYAIGVASGTDAIKLGLCALGIGLGDEVITVSHTAVATIAVCEQCGAVPVMVDIDPSTYTMDPGWLDKVISPRTRAIIPVHLYGHPADLEPKLEIANRKGIDV